MRSAEFVGRQHRTLGAIAASAEGPVAIALCRGGAQKRYSYTDPNEDACCFAIGPGGFLAAVADGHHGERGAERVVHWLLEERAAALTAPVAIAADDAGWCAMARELILDAHREVMSQARELKVAPAPTTLSIALVRPAENRVIHAAIGDSHVFFVPEESTAGTRDLGWAATRRRRSFFLGDAFEAGLPKEEHFVVGCEPPDDLCALVLASDGLSEFGIGVEDPAATVDACARQALSVAEELRPLEACRSVTEAAIDAHRANRSGDNIATAVLWLKPARR